MRSIAQLFGRSPLGPVREHMTRVREAVSRVPDLFDAVLAGDARRTGSIQEEISKFEYEADQIKNDIRDHLPRSLFMAVDRRDLLEVLAVQDAIADCAEDVAVLVTLRQMSLPASLTEDFRPFMQKSVDVALSTATIVDELHDVAEAVFGGPGADKVLRLIDVLERTEHESDLLQHSLVKKMFAMESEMEPVALMMWLKIFDRIGDLANLSERLVNRIRLMLAK